MAESQTFEQTYPAVSRWVLQCGWLEIGRVYWTRSLIRALDEGGMVWEGGETADNLSAALDEAEAALTAWMRENFGADR